MKGNVVLNLYKFRGALRVFEMKLTVQQLIGCWE